jgi:phenylpropionate dioxygenase-like ring-hydroxylating dioxygenase large terminal subunit
MDDAGALAPTPVREGISTSGPDRNWPMNCWWVAAHSSEISATPTSRWMLGMPIALYRKGDGKPVALHNRCPHRWAPLSKGKVQGDDLVCIYHGMQFSPSGQCVRVPSQKSTPPAIRVRSFPAVERYCFIWIWTGDVAKADPALIPDELAYLSDPAWHHVWGYRAVDGNYMQLKENVLDLTHFAFLHKDSLGIEGWEQAPWVKVTEDRVTFGLEFQMEPLARIYSEPAGKPAGFCANRAEWGMQLSPAAHHAGTDMHDPNAGPGGLEYFKQRFVHITTPVSIGKSHYFWAIARDHGGPFDVEASRAFADVVFDEDIGVIEATQAIALRAADQDSAVEFRVAADLPSVSGRRQIERLVKTEREDATSAIAAK